MSCKTLNRQNPIITLYLESVSEIATVGPNLSISLKIPQLGETFRVSKNTRKRILKQFYYADLGGSSLDLELDLHERDPVIQDRVSKSTNLLIDFNKEYGENGFQNFTVTMDADEGPVWGHRTGKWEFKFRWYLAPNVQDTIQYIVNEMKVNQSGTRFNEIKTYMDLYNTISFNHQKRALEHVALIRPSSRLASEQFADLVGYNKVWDHKPCILAETGQFAFHLGREFRFRWDVWSNIHYGYIGMALGFDKKILIDAAGVAQEQNDSDPSMLKVLRRWISGSLDKLDDIADTAAVKLGIKMWEDHGNGITWEILENAVLNTRMKIKREKTDKQSIKDYTKTNN